MWTWVSHSISPGRLHRVETYPWHVNGVRQVVRRTERSHLDVDTGDRPRELYARITGRAQVLTMEWQTTDGP
ncbi:hypothetical protein ACF08N_20620 [Streptomyces sp. NPDC015127]|uniref:hypothetical protein n=1 Tax=Streptomyces sp. NPDC015127 TaxID=3364939 RepID=UPI0037001692